MIGLIAGAAVVWIGLQGHLWHPRGRWPATPPPPCPGPLPAAPDGCWWDAPARCWWHRSGLLWDQGRGTVRCTGDALYWLGWHGTLTLGWPHIVAIHAHPNGLLIHTDGLPPVVLSLASPAANAQWYAWLTTWQAHAWVWQAGAWWPSG